MDCSLPGSVRGILQARILECLTAQSLCQVQVMGANSLPTASAEGLFSFGWSSFISTGVIMAPQFLRIVGRINVSNTGIVLRAEPDTH